MPSAIAPFEETQPSMVDMSAGDSDEIRSFDISRYMKRELKQLKRKFVSELEQVRNVMNRIESEPIVSKRGRDSNLIFHPSPVPIQILDSPPQKHTPPKNASRSKPHSRKKMLKQSQKKLPGAKCPFSSIQNRGPKRNMVDPAIGKMSTIMKKGCNEILGDLMKHQFAWVFNKPVNVAQLGLIDYHRIIKNPMDLGTVKSKLQKGDYGTPLAFAADVRLTFNNAMMYSTEGQDVHSIAQDLLSIFNSRFIPLSKKFEDERKMLAAVADEKVQQLMVEDVRRADPVVQMQLSKESKSEQMTMTVPSHDDHAQMQSSLIQARTPSESLNVKSVPGKLPKPKAREANKRAMSYEEKLGMILQNLPPEKMEQLISIIKERNVHLAQDGDEIELDLELMDNETLWELDRFVSNFYKSMNKLIRQGQENITNNQFGESEIVNKSTVSENPEMLKNKNRETAAPEEDIDIGEEIPMSHFPPVEIEKDVGNASGGESSSSGWASSDSGSSSSSGSGSSSGSESDADSVKSPNLELNQTTGS